MNRRDLLKASGIATVGLMMAFPKKALAQATNQSLTDEPNPDLQLTGEISRNHGHAFKTLTLTQVVLLLQQVHREAQPAVISIQGTSGHPHSVALSQEVLVQILSEGQAELVSSIDANHSHAVQLVLAPIA